MNTILWSAVWDWHDDSLLSIVSKLGSLYTRQIRLADTSWPLLLPHSVQIAIFKKNWNVENNRRKSLFWSKFEFEVPILLAF